jgi:hypothetical protein
VLDHVFTDAIGALREVLEDALLERQAFEERFQVDVLLGDTTWETSYGLPGEGSPPRVRVDVTLLWPTWAQSAYRTWYLGEELDEPPRIDVELVYRMQRLCRQPELGTVLDLLPETSPDIATEPLHRAGPTVETVYGQDLQQPSYAVEVSYEGTYDFSDAVLEDGAVLDEHFSALGGWIASLLVKLGDVPFEYHPAEPESA